MMTRTFNLLTPILLLISFNISAQNVKFATEGVIEFERNTNLHAIIKKRMAKDDNGFSKQIYESLLKNQPQFRVSKSTLYFSGNKTLFKPDGEEVPIPYFGNDATMSQINNIFMDLTTSQQVTQKKVYEETFLLTDSTRKINWKITSETRDIAGYTCRRANALVMDSIYVVAFYTDEIPVSSGPESFNGLPGMILGVALPHENTTWFAKSVTDKVIAGNVVVAPSKGKKTDIKGLTTTLKDALKNWGSEIQTALKAYLL